MKIESGDLVIAVLHSPREKLFGQLSEISTAGVGIRAIELGYFEDWCRAISEGEPHLPMTEQFIPMWRVERLTRDEPTEGAPSLAEQFTKRTGRDLIEF